MQFEIIGLYDIPLDRELRGEDLRYAQFVRGNNIDTIYVPNWISSFVSNQVNKAQISRWESSEFEMPDDYRDWLGESSEEWLGTQFFVLKDPLLMDDFLEAATQMLPNEYYYFIDLFSDFNAIAASMQNLQNISNWILYGSVIGSIVILGLMIGLFLHDRRNEIGVYLALGEEKFKIVLQILLEVSMISIIGISLAILIGHQISSRLSANIVETELLSQISERERSWDDFAQLSVFDQLGIPRAQLTAEEMMESFDISLDAMAVGLFYAVGLGVVFAATSIPIIYIVKLSPKEVLL